MLLWFFFLYFLQYELNRRRFLPTDFSASLLSPSSVSPPPPSSSLFLNLILSRNASYNCAQLEKCIHSVFFNAADDYFSMTHCTVVPHNIHRMTHEKLTPKIANISYVFVIGSCSLLLNWFSYLSERKLRNCYCFL